MSETVATRRAVVTGHRDAAQVARYLPAGYHVVCSTAFAADGSPLDRPGLLIEGTDDCGWTLEDYVIPRLASGLIWATAVEEGTA